MLRLLLLVIASLLIVENAHGDSCLAKNMYGFDPNFFYSESQRISLTYCEESSGNSCCTADYSEQIGQLQDPFSNSFRQIINNPTDEADCRTKLEDISCIMCSTAQTDWIYLGEDASTLVICKSFCDNLYDSCSTQVYNGNNTIRISEQYSSGTEFCIGLFNGISHSNNTVKVLVDSHNRECWQDLPECTADSYYAVYTECIGGRRNKIWVRKPEAECSGGVENPPNEPNLPCAINCDAGQRIQTDSCVDCEPGTYSLGSDILEDSWSTPDDLVLQFNSYCTWRDSHGVERVWTEGNCDGWSLNFGAISSPVSLNDSMSAYLETSFTMIDEGVITFSAKVDSELNYDGLKVYVDRIMDTNIGFVSHSESFVTYTINLNAGYHFIQFEYYKDISLSVGLDQATINMIRVTNVRYASDYCTPCSPGKYASDPASSSCTNCPLNYYSESHGATECLPCPDGTYALAGSSSCLPQPECDTTSYYFRYGQCYYDAVADAPRRTKTANWVDPHICVGELPTFDPVECPPCEPGMQRDENGVDCHFCPEGFYSTGDNSPCQSCAAGKEAIRHLVYDEFIAFAYGLSTSCQYDCNTDGWVMREDLIDSGTGHGSYVLSRLTFEQTFPADGSITFQYQLECEVACILTFQSDEIAYRAYGGPGTFSSSSTLPFAVTAGHHIFEWVFTRDDQGTGQGINDRAIIYKIDAQNTAEGGAIACTSCLPGYFNPYPNRPTCTPASIGFYSPGSVTQQTPCIDNTFTDKEGQSSCQSCGENVNALSDHSACDVTCTLTTTTLADGLNTYDVTPLTRNDNEMYGPIWDNRNQTYYLNMCEKQHNGHTCFSADNVPLETYVCQVTDVGIGEDLGSTFGIIPLRSEYYPTNTLGVTIHLTNGAQCHNGSHYFPRQTYIDILCDPNAGIGSPISFLDTNDVETEKCVYQLKWYSLYGCPTCKETDYHYTTSECINGFENYIYAWNTNPKKCHSGLSLPDNQIDIPCNSSMYCPPGEYYSANDNQCLQAPIGFYSIGNGIEINQWDNYDDLINDGFTLNGFIQDENYISSGIGDTSLVFVSNFVVNGSITFTYEVNNYGDSTAGFYIYIDDILQDNKISSTFNNYQTKSIEIQPGYHYIKFLFEGGTKTTSNERARQVKIKSMIILGITWHSDFPTPCPPGTFSNSLGSTNCINCGWNTYSQEASRYCIGCPSNEYSFPGSFECTTKESCTISDYSLYFTDCIDGVQNSSYVLLEPVICLEDNITPTPENPTQECFSCELGSYRDEETQQCKTCTAGKYYDTDSQKCKTSKPGSAAILKKSYFINPISGDEFPSEFYTGCNGNCFCDNSNCNTDGWRFRGSYVDSGLNENREVDTFLSLDLDIINPGSISFDYEVFGQSSNGLEFFINEKQYDVIYHPSSSSSSSKSITSISIPISPGRSLFTWNYHQESDSSGYVQLHSIVIEGLGGATDDIPCPIGTYSDNAASSFCIPCPLGTSNSDEGSTGCEICDSNSYTISEGSSECIPCGYQTQANDDRTDCTTNCHFTFGNGDNEDVYDLSSLQLTHGPFPLDDEHSSHSDVTHGIWMNVCEKRTSSTFCLDSYGDSISTFMCAVDTRGNGIDYGNHLSVALVDIQGSKNKAVQLSYSVVGDDTNHCSTVLTVVCDPDSSSQLPFVVDDSSDCNLHMRWNSAHGCRICRDDDYEENESECVDGERTITKVRVNDCFGSLMLDTTTETCPTRYSFSLAVIIVVVIIVVVLFVIIVAAILYNRRLHSQYIALVRESEGQYEMDEMEDTSVSDQTASESKTEDAV